MNLSKLRITAEGDICAARFSAPSSPGTPSEGGSRCVFRDLLFVHCLFLACAI